MLKNTSIRKTLSVLIIIILVSIFVMPAHALTMESVDQTSVIYNQLNDDDLFLSEDVATYVAQFFINDMVATGNTQWTKETEIQSIEILYDATGEAVIGYSVELDQGYVVVSAYVDMPSLILEWSDTAIPLYEEFNVANVEKVLYVNTLEYYCADKTKTLYTIDGVEVSSEGLTNTLVEMRDVSNIDANVLDSIVSMKEENEYGLMPYDDTAGGEITDPFTYAKNVYGGTWTSTEWANNWENYMNYSLATDFEGYTGRCGPAAITNIIKAYGNKYNNSTIKNATSQQVFDKLMEVNEENNNEYFTSPGTPVETTPDFIKKGFAKFRVQVRVYGTYTPTYDNVKNATTSNRLMYLIVWNNKPYGNHALVGYAYTQLVNGSGSYISFLKVADGWNRSGRYLPISSLSSDAYYEVYFS